MTFAARTQMGATAGGGGGGGGGFPPVSHGYVVAGTFTETIPGDPISGVGPSQLVARVGGPGGGGANGGGGVGGGGGSGAICERVIALTSADWGKTFILTLTPGAGPSGASGATAFPGQTSTASTIVNGSFATAVNMVAGPGQGGQTNGAGGAGGIASGGTTNVSGNTAPPASGAPPVSVGTVFSGGGGAPNPAIGSPGQAGNTGTAAFSYT